MAKKRFPWEAKIGRRAGMKTQVGRVFYIIKGVFIFVIVYEILHKLGVLQ
ncbi:hypothetical protein [Mannheimia massilioguelmaensis]|nr:hypothetical protein [Mannheimia massilioguelmaensis]